MVNDDLCIVIYLYFCGVGGGGGLWNHQEHDTTLYTILANLYVLGIYVLSGHSKKDQTKILMTNGSLMKLESIAECSPWAFCNTFDLY